MAHIPEVPRPPPNPLAAQMTKTKNRKFSEVENA